MLQSSDDGFSLVEVIIAIFLMGVLSLAVLPLMIGATQTSIVNRDLFAATAFAKSRLSSISAAYSAAPGITSTSCGTLSDYADMPAAKDAATGFEAHVTVGPCPDIYPASVPVSVVVTDDGATVALVTTRVRVGRA